MKKKLIGSIFFATLFITGCGTTNSIKSDTNVTKESRAESGYEVKANKTYLRDWTARSVSPLKNLILFFQKTKIR